MAVVVVEDEVGRWRGWTGWGEGINAWHIRTFFCIVHLRSFPREGELVEQRSVTTVVGDSNESELSCGGG